MNFLMKALLKQQLKQFPQDMQDKIMKIAEENPELLQKIATEIKSKIDSGMDKQNATMAVVGKYQNELKDLLK